MFTTTAIYTYKFAASMQSNKNKKWWLTPLLLILAIIVLRLISLQGYWIEKIYSTHTYPLVASLLRILTGWLPFSFGDILYGLTFLWFLYKTIQFFRHKPTWRKFLFALRNLAVKFLWVYLFFLLMWGLNYYRYGIGYQLNIIPESLHHRRFEKYNCSIAAEFK